MAGLEMKAHIPWLKLNPAPRVRKGGWRSSYEMLFIGSKGSIANRMGKVEQQKLLNWEIETVCPNCKLEHGLVYGHAGEFQEFDWPVAEMSAIEPSGNRLHVAQKPEWLIAKYIKMLTEPGELIVDPMCGSGTIPWVAAKLGRRWAANDSDYSSVLITRERLRNVQLAIG